MLVEWDWGVGGGLGLQKYVIQEIMAWCNYIPSCIQKPQPSTSGGMPYALVTAIAVVVIAVCFISIIWHNTWNSFSYANKSESKTYKKNIKVI